MFQAYASPIPLEQIYYNTLKIVHLMKLFPYKPLFQGYLGNAYSKIKF